MNRIDHPLITKTGEKWLATCCSCSKNTVYAQKASAIAMVSRGTCRFCSKRHTAIIDSSINIYKRQDGKWCSRCSGCGKEQAYTRKDHARQSSANDWQCKICVARLKRYSNNGHTGRKQSLYNRYKASAKSRGIDWSLTEGEMFSCYNGICALTGWVIDLDRESDQPASLDRIDSQKGYHAGNIQWVHSMVNMSKNKYPQDLFVKMCKAVADKAKW